LFGAAKVVCNAAPGQLRRSPLKLMFPILPLWLIVLLLLIELAIVAACAVGCGLLLNWILKTPLGRHLVSTSILAALVYFIADAILLYTLPPLRWVNEIPQDTRTWLWDHLRTLDIMVTLLCITLWQVIVRIKRGLTVRQPA
jgi:hypothetical protein